MLNFAGQDILKGSYVGQSARTGKGMKHRVGVVLGYVDAGLRVAWYDVNSGSGSVESVVEATYLFKIDPATFNPVWRAALDYAKVRGHAAVDEVVEDWHGKAKTSA